MDQVETSGFGNGCLHSGFLNFDEGSWTLDEKAGLNVPGLELPLELGSEHPAGGYGAHNGVSHTVQRALAG